MKKLICWCWPILPLTVLSQNYNPFVSQGIISPAPLLPLEANGTGTASFIVGNSGSDELSLVADQEMLLIITLNKGVPNNADPIAAISGTFKSYFNWLYDPAIKTYQGKQNKVIPGGLNGAGTIIIAYRVTDNSSMLSPQNGFNCNITPPAYSNGINSLADDQVSSYTWTSFTVSGNVFDDADGYADALIDGIGSNAGSNLYVSLVSSGNSIIATVPVNNDGTYTMFPPAGGDYTLVLHTNSAGSSTSNLPTNWVNTAEGIGSVGDGTTNGYININLTTDNINNGNYGIDQLPQTEDVNDIVPLGIAQGEKFLLDNMPLNGSDPEDGNMLSTGYAFLITSLPVNANLYYNDILITPGDVAAAMGTALINNYDPLLLSAVFTITPVANTQAVFTYAAYDAAGQPDPTSASYTITVTTILPADNIVLTVQRKANDVNLSWAALAEEGVDYYKIEKSTDGRFYHALNAKVMAKGNSNQTANYDLLDKNETNAVVLYRIRAYRRDGKMAISNTVVVRMENNRDKIHVFPNPVTDQFYVSFPAAGKYKLQLMDASGKVVLQRDMEVSVNNLNALFERSVFVAGNYQLSIQNSLSGKRENVKLIFIQR